MDAAFQDLHPPISHLFFAKNNYFSLRHALGNVAVLENA